MTSQQYDKDDALTEEEIRLARLATSSDYRPLMWTHATQAAVHKVIQHLMANYAERAGTVVPESQPINAAPASATPSHLVSMLHALAADCAIAGLGISQATCLNAADRIEQLERELAAHEAVRDACFEALGPECRVWGDVPGHIEELKRELAEQTAIARRETAAAMHYSQAAVSATQERVSEHAPYPNCRYQVCDLPGQCIGDGKCHHPQMVPAPVSTRPECKHEPYQGKCVHCGIGFFNGLPASATQERKDG